MAEMERSGRSTAVAGWRFSLGVVLFALSLLGPFVLIPLLSALGLSPAMLASTSGATLIGAEVLLIAAAAIMGKSGYAYLKDRTLGLLRQYGPPKEVGRARYYIGLAIFIIPFLFGWMAPYARELVPLYAGNEVRFALTGDLLLLISLFVLGGDFWDKLRALFFYGAKAVFPGASAGSKR